jgi:hypothetical protein
VVVEVEAEVAVVIEEGSAVLRRDLLVPCPFGGEEYCGVGAPLRYQFYTNGLAPTSWNDSQPHGEEEQRREVKRDTKGTGKDSKGPFGVKQFLKEFLSLFSCIPPQEAKYLYFTSFILQNIAPNSEASWKLWNLKFLFCLRPLRHNHIPFLLSQYVGASLLYIYSLPKIAILQFILTFGDEGQSTSPVNFSYVCYSLARDEAQAAFSPSS